MVLEFKFENFSSFKDSVSLNFEASSDEHLEDYYVHKIGKYRILKTAVIFGANASGKSNVLFAINKLREIATQPKADKSQKTSFIPFLLDSDYSNKEGKFEVTFFIEDTKYKYIVVLDQNIIYNENLYIYKTSKPTTIYKRYYNSEKAISMLELGHSINIELDEFLKLKANLINNTTVLGAFAKSNVEFKEIEIVYNFFLNVFLPMIENRTELYRFSLDYYDNSDNKFKKFIKELLQKSDFNISNIKLKKSNYDDTVLNDLIEKRILPEIISSSIKGKKIINREFLFTHIVNDREFKEQEFGIHYESLGTKRIVELSAPFYELIHNNRILTIDEIDSSLHPELVEFLLKIFLENSQKSQLIFTTHNVNILDNKDIIRKDVIWFTQKNLDGASELFSLKDFNIRKELSYYNAYKLGKFGASPYFGDPIINTSQDD